MKGDDAELFIAMFEAALRSNNVPPGQWKNKLHAHLSLRAKTRIQTVIQDKDSTHDEVKEALLGCSAMTFSSAAEDLCTGKRGRLFSLEPRQAIDKMIRLVGKVASEAEDKQDILNCMGVTLTRNWLDPPIKSYVDMTRKFEVNEYIRTIEEWERSQPVGTPCFQRTFSGYQQSNTSRQNSSPYQTKKPVTGKTSLPTVAPAAETVWPPRRVSGNLPALSSLPSLSLVLWNLRLQTHVGLMPKFLAVVGIYRPGFL